MWKQKERGYEEVNESNGNVPRCPYCNRQLEYVIEQAEANQVVYYNGIYNYTWNGEYFEFDNAEDWEEVDTSDWEDEGTGEYRCPHCSRDITEFLRSHGYVEA